MTTAVSIVTINVQHFVCAQYKKTSSGLSAFIMYLINVLDLDARVIFMYYAVQSE